MKSEGHPYVVVRGNVGAGKSTLAPIVASELGVPFYAEDVSQLSFVGDFFQDMPRWAIHHELDCLVMKAQQEREIAKSTGGVQDRDLRESFEIFVTKYHDDGHLSDREFALLRHTYQLLSAFTPTPDLVVYLCAPVDTLMARVASRGWGHESGVSREWLDDLNSRYERWLGSPGAERVVRIESGLGDPRVDLSLRQRLITAIREAIGR